LADISAVTVHACGKQPLPLTQQFRPELDSKTLSIEELCADCTVQARRLGDVSW